MKLSTGLRSGLSLLVTAIAFYWITQILGWQQLQQVLSSSQTGWLIAAVSVFVLSLLCRAIRVGYMYPGMLGFAWSFRAVSFASVMNFLLPARIGEFSLVALLSKFLNLDFRAVGLSVLVIRVQELVYSLIIAGILFFAFRSTVLIEGAGFQIRQVSPWFLICAAALVLVALLLLYVFRESTHLKHSRGVIQDWRINLLSAAIAFMMLLTILCVAKWLVIENAVVITPMVFIAVLLVSFIPVNGLANVGGYHLAWAAPLLAMGYSRDQAVPLAVSAHLGVSGLVLLALLATLITDLFLARRGKTRSDLGKEA